MAKRDQFCDSRRDGPAIRQEEAQSYVDMRPSTLDEEAAGKGWIRTTAPCGGPPNPTVVAGSRGEPYDIDTPGHDADY